MKEFIINDESELSKVAETLLIELMGKRKFTLTGGLGAGKTTFVKAFCARLGVIDVVTSPSFSIVNIYSYTTSDGKERFVNHIDLYRLKNLQEALDIGIEDYLYDENYCLLEWPEIAESILPEEVVRINITIESPLRRKILIL
jgi:tRNA threonylcarbamoyladenosine biosynthesis protein TsaE